MMDSTVLKDYCKNNNSNNNYKNQKPKQKKSPQNPTLSILFSEAK